MNAISVSQSQWRLCRYLIILVFGALLWQGQLPAAAAGETIVTLCDVDNQPGAGINLNTALAIGGRITFNCPVGSVLLITSEKLLHTDVQLDGYNNGNFVELRNEMPTGTGLIRMMLQSFPGTMLELVNINLTAAGNTYAGGVTSQGGMRAINTRFEGFYLGLDAARGQLLVRNSRFTYNNISVSLSAGMQRAEIVGTLFMSNSRGVVGAQGLFPTANGMFIIAGSIFSQNYTGIQHCSDDDCPTPFPLTVVNSIIANSTDGRFASVRGQSIHFINSTIIGNHGLGINVEGGGSIELVNTIVANNSGDNCRGTIQDSGSNLQYPSGSCGATIGVAEPNLSNLLEPLSGSPALGTGNLQVCTGAPVNSIDYYGQVRPRGEACSIGAVEGKVTPPPVPRSRREQREPNG